MRYTRLLLSTAASAVTVLAACKKPDAAKAAGPQTMPPTQVVAVEARRDAVSMRGLRASLSSLSVSWSRGSLLDSSTRRRHCLPPLPKLLLTIMLAAIAAAAPVVLEGDEDADECSGG